MIPRPALKWGHPVSESRPYPVLISLIRSGVVYWGRVLYSKLTLDGKLIGTAVTGNLRI